MRMQGAAVHAVPKPPDRWMLPLEEELKLRAEKVVDDYDFDFNEDEDEDGARGVILFNTWNTPPSGVDGDYAAPSGVTVSGDYMEEERRLKEEEWAEEYPDGGIKCLDRERWIKQTVQYEPEAPQQTLNVALMGTEARRGKYVRVRLTGAVHTQALFEEKRVTLLTLTE